MANEDVNIGNDYYPKRHISYKTGFDGIRQVKVPWDESAAFAAEAVFYSPNNQWPTEYGANNSICIEATAVPFPGSAVRYATNGMVSYDYALVTLKYSTNVFKATNNVLGFEELKGHEETKRISNISLRWGSASGDVLLSDELPVVHPPAMTYVRGYVGMDSIPSGMMFCKGKINSGPVFTQTLGIWFAPETLRFDDYVARRQLALGSQNKFALEYCFTWMPNWNDAGTALGWNAEWNPAANEFQYIYLENGTRYTPNKPTNMNVLWP